MRNLKQIRKRQGLSLAGLSKLTDIHPTALARYEAGKRAPSFERGLLVASKLGVSPYELAGISPPAHEGETPAKEQSRGGSR